MMREEPCLGPRSGTQNQITTWDLIVNSASGGSEAAKENEIEKARQEYSNSKKWRSTGTAQHSKIYDESNTFGGRHRDREGNQNAVARAGAGGRAAPTMTSTRRRFLAVTCVMRTKVGTRAASSSSVASLWIWAQSPSRMPWPSKRGRPDLRNSYKDENWSGPCTSDSTGRNEPSCRRAGRWPT